MDLRLVPAAVSAWACAWLITGSLVPAWTVLGAGLVAGWWWRRRPSVWATCAVIGVSALICGGWVHVITTSRPAVWCADGAHVNATVRIRAEPRAASSRFAPQYRVGATAWKMDARGAAWHGRLPIELVVADPTMIPQAGSVVTVTGVGAGRRASDGSVGTIRVHSSEITSQPGFLDRLANRLRAGLVSSMEGASSVQGALVPSLVVGDTSALDDSTKEEFRATGLTHVLAVSGSNFSLALAFTGWAARAAGVRGWWLRFIAVAVSVVFVVTCRSEPSVLRATVMGLIALGATGVGAPAGRSARNLSLAVILLLCADPWLARSWGFALSVAATVGIVWWTPRWIRCAPQWIPMWVRQSLFISLSAQIATQPMVTALSDQVSLVAPFANLCVGPFLGPVTVLGLLAAMTALVAPTLGQGIGWAAGWCAQPIISVAHLMSEVPGATFGWPATGMSLLLLSGMCLVLGQWAVPVLLQRRWTMILVLASLVGALIAPPRQFGWPGDWAVVACDVGQGGAVVVRVATTEAILVDVGPEPALLRACLGSLGVVRISLLVLTHPHADHIGGLSALSDMPIDMVLVGDDRSAEVVGRTLGRPATMTTGGQVISVGEAHWRTLAVGPVGHTNGDSDVDSPAENDAGVVGLITVQGLRTLVTGDLEEAGQRRVLEEVDDVSADVLVVPHHGSARQDPDFVRAVGARISLIQVGQHNVYGHPTRSALALVESTGSSVWRTDRDGAVAVTTGGAQVITQK